MKIEIEYWKQMILTLQDDSFFDLMQIWLGEIQSPFNKQDLVSRLENFLLRPKIQSRILELLDIQDKALLTAIELAPNKTVDSLYKYFAKEVSFPTYSLKLINMEQRLLIYRKAVPHANHHEETLHINPLLHAILAKEVLNIYHLILPLECKPDNEKTPWLNDTLLLAFYSYIEENHPSLKMDGNWKKKEKEKLGELIPVLKSSITGIDRMEWIKAILFKLNLIQIRDNKIYNIDHNWKQLGTKDPHDILFKVMIAGITTSEHCLSQKEEDNSSEEILFEQKQPNPLTAHEIERIGNAFADLSTFISNGVVYNQIQFEKLLLLVGLEKYLLPGLEMSLFLDLGNETLQVNPIFRRDKEIPRPQPQAIIESNFDAIIKPWSDWEKALTLASLAHLTYCDRYPHYQINRTSFCQALDKGYKGKAIISDLEFLTDLSLPQNIQLSFIDWEKQFKRIRLVQGTLLIIAPEEIPFLIGSGLLTPYLIESLAEGVYLLDENKRSEWEKALHQCGIEEIPTPESPGIPKEHFQTLPFPSFNHFVQKSSHSTTAIWTEKQQKEIPHSLSRTGKKEKELLHPEEKAIEAKIESLNLSSEIKEEYYARLKKRLILTPDSVTKPSLKFEKREARGLDFRGKLAIIQHALLSQKELLEITLLNTKNTDSPLLIFPKILCNNKDQKILKGITLDSEHSIEVDLNQIKSVRRLLSALFFPED